MEIKLNLIPQYRKEEIAQAKKMRLVLRWEIELLVMVAIFFALLLSLDYLLGFNLAAQSSEFESKQSKEKYERIVSLDSNFKSVNALVALDESVQNDQLHWSRLFEKLSVAMPEGVSVSKLANKNYQILIAGTADTRDILINTKERLAQDSCFVDINLPLSNLAAKNNVEFQIEFNVKEECVKNK